MAVFVFLLKAYNMDSETYEEIGQILRRTMRGRTLLSYAELHRIFYREFELGYCTK